MPRGKGRAWSEAEIDIVLARKYRDDVIAQMIGRSIDCVRRKRYLLRMEKNPKPEKPEKPEKPKYANGVCNMTCPDYCPHKDCKLSGAQILSYQYKLKKQKGVVE